MNKGIEIKLPVIKRSKMTGKALKRKYSEKTFYFDMSLASEVRFEQKFPTEYKAYGDLQQFTERVRVVEDINKAKLVTILKCMYCYFDTKYSFVDFLHLFDISDIEYIHKLVDKLRLAFNIILENASEKN